MPITRTADAKESGGFQQVREALVCFEGDCVGVMLGQWNDGKEYYDIDSVNVRVVESTEPLSMDISQRYSFRVKAHSAHPNSFYVKSFLKSIEDNKLLFPDDLEGKRLRWKVFVQEASDPTYNAKGIVLDAVVGESETMPPVIPDVEQLGVAGHPSNNGIDPQAIFVELANGKTEAQIKSAVALQPELRSSPMFPMIQSGAMLQTMVEEGHLVLGEDSIYRIAG